MEFRHVPAAKLGARTTWQGLSGQIWPAGLVFDMWHKHPIFKKWMWTEDRCDLPKSVFIIVFLAQNVTWTEFFSSSNLWIAHSLSFHVYSLSLNCICEGCHGCHSAWTSNISTFLSFQLHEGKGSSLQEKDNRVLSVHLTRIFLYLLEIFLAWKIKMIAAITAKDWWAAIYCIFVLEFSYLECFIHWLGGRKKMAAQLAEKSSIKNASMECTAHTFISFSPKTIKLKLLNCWCA